METYNFQVKEDNKSWFNIPHKSIKFENRTVAAKFAKNLATMEQREVRLTVGEDNVGGQGSYVSPDERRFASY